MKAYLDNNIIVAIEYGTYSLDKLNKILKGSQLELFFSAPHLYEVEHFKGNSTITREQLISKRLNTLFVIAQRNYLYDKKPERLIGHSQLHPSEVFTMITNNKIAIPAIKSLINLLPSHIKNEIRIQLGVESIKVNNYSPKEVIQHLNSKLTNWGTGNTFEEMIELAINLNPDGKNFGIQNRFSSVFEFLDILGYWRDKETESSNYSRLWDSSHAFYASYCDYFVSDDRNTRFKTMVAYDIYNINTKIVSSSGEIFN